MYTTRLLVRKDYYIMNSRTTKIRRENIIMSYISKEEEETLEREGAITIKRDNCTFNITIKDCYCYGIIDFHQGSDDCNLISTFDWLDNKIMQGFPVPSKYDYDNHVCISDLPKGRWYDTFRPEVMARYVHGVLGKPERTIIFSEVINYGKSK